jgi:PAS domain S-box-containing protein
MISTMGDNMKTYSNAPDIVAHLPYFVIVTNAQGEIKSANLAALDIFGKNESNIMDTNIDALIKPVSDNKIMPTIARALDTDGNWQGELVVADDSSQMLLEISIIKTSSCAEESSETQVIYCGQDITKRRHLERKKIHDERAGIRGEMAGEISHELYN